jgi:diguanylate cyclase (GGDEF)-like protein
MMKKESEQIEILAIGRDSTSVEALKTVLAENNVVSKLSLLKDISQLDAHEKSGAEAVFFFSNRQNEKTWKDVRQIKLQLPKAAITLVSPKPDHQGIIGAFRAGVFDFLAIPLDQNEVRNVLYRLKLNEVIKSGEWNPERAVLHLFSRPESFSSLQDIAEGLKQYLTLFLKIDEENAFVNGREMFAAISLKEGVSKHQIQKLKTFIKDRNAVIFGLKFEKDACHFIIKIEEEKYSYLVATNTSGYPIRSILSDYLTNVLKTAVSILSESKAIEEIRLLALTDEVTGCFNQRKLVEDLNFFIARYPHERVGFSLLFVDIDYFKNVNDQYGHVVGSQLLIDMSSVLKNQLRSSDLVYRYGGDEFIVLLPRTNIEETKKIALRISDSVKSSEFNIENGGKYKLSLSVGIAEYPTDAQSAKSII